MTETLAARVTAVPDPTGRRAPATGDGSGIGKVGHLCSPAGSCSNGTSMSIDGGWTAR